MRKTKLHFDCPKCERGTVRPIAKAGRTMRYRRLWSLDVPKTLVVPTCDECGEMWLDAVTSRKLTRSLEKQFRAELRARAARFIEILTEEISQQQLEQLLGQSQGYLSKLKSGARTPSPELVLQLGLIAKDPKRRLAEIRDLLKH